MECGNLVTAFWPTAACKHPSSHVPDLPTPICDLRHLVSSTFVVPPSGGFPSVTQDKNHEIHESHEKQSRYRTEAHRGSRGRRWLALPTSTQRQQVDWAFRAPRVGSLTDPLACASSSCALAASPLQARSASKWIRRFRSWLCRGEAAYGVRKLVAAFWPTAACNHPSSRVPDLPTPIHDLRRLVSSTFVVPPSGGFPSVTQDKNHEIHESHEKQSRYRTEAHRGSRGRRWLALPTSTQRQQVDWAFRAPRVGSLTDPLACASSSYALARPPYKHAAPASGSGVSVLTSPRRSRLWSAGTCYRFLVYSRPQTPRSRIPDLPTPICDLRHLVSLRHTCQESVNPEPPQSAASGRS